MVEAAVSLNFPHAPTVSLKFFQAGYCTHPQGMVLRGAPWRSAKFPATFALIEHPSVGKILFDTGYTQRFFAETQPFPFRLYAWTTPVYMKTGESAVEQLQAQGISADQIRCVIISHFHGDHIGGLRDFPAAQFIYQPKAYQAVKDRQGLRAVKAGFLKGLLPDDFEQRAIFTTSLTQVPLAPAYAPFITGMDLFGDGSLLGVDLPGHAIGQLGLILRDHAEQAYFLIADACWLSRAYQQFVLPHPLANLVQANAATYGDTLQKLHQLHRQNPTLKIIPAHCAEAWQQMPQSVKSQHVKAQHVKLSERTGLPRTAPQRTGLERTGREKP